ncbi:hypothetical protein H0H93_015144, partial [Arthromyces matolae]
MEEGSSSENTKWPAQAIIDIPPRLLSEIPGLGETTFRITIPQSDPETKSWNSFMGVILTLRQCDIDHKDFGFWISLIEKDFHLEVPPRASQLLLRSDLQKTMISHAVALHNSKFSSPPQSQDQTRFPRSIFLFNSLFNVSLPADFPRVLTIPPPPTLLPTDTPSTISSRHEEFKSLYNILTMVYQSGIVAKWNEYRAFIWKTYGINLVIEKAKEDSLKPDISALENAINLHNQKYGQSPAVAD